MNTGNSTIFTDTRAAASDPVRTAFLRNVYGWMAGGLALSAIAALIVVKSDTLMSTFIFNKTNFYILLFAELGLVFGLSMAIKRISVNAAAWMFILYSVLNGLTLSVVSLMYTPSSIFQALVVSSSVFAAAAFYGTVTKRDLAKFGAYLFMALIGLIVATIINIFMASIWLDWALTYGGVLLFTALTAYDAQKIQRIGYEASHQGGDAMGKASIIGALALYLDFVNLFLYMLRIFGRGRD